MANLDAHGNPIIAAHVTAPAQAEAGQPLIDLSQLRTALSNPKEDITLYFRDSVMGNGSAKFLLDRIKIAHTTYGWTDEMIACNFKLA